MRLQSRSFFATDCSVQTCDTCCLLPVSFGCLCLQVRLPGDKVERQFADGSRLTLFRNGTSQFSAPDNYVKVIAGHVLSHLNGKSPV